jgi:hypothetical protein
MAEENPFTTFQVDADENIEDAFLLVHLLAASIASGGRIERYYPDVPFGLFERPGDIAQFFKGPFKISGAMLCPFLRPMKGAQFQADARHFRDYFRGICNSEGEAFDRQISTFFRAIKINEVLLINEPEEVIKRNFYDFFYNPYEYR